MNRMTQSQLEAVLAEINKWLEPQEKLRECTIGKHPGVPWGVVLALTDKYLRFGSTVGGRNIPFSEIEYIKWSSLWARLTVGTNSSPKPLRFSINGREWKERAARIAQIYNIQI